ncbi:MAG: SRPBCC family protein [Acidimicrobiia bacterium]|jgi:uncharacterized protein YndB with AHSA1/START domain
MMIDKQTSVLLEIAIEVPVPRAYQLFTQEFDRIKPREHNLLDVDIAETVLEPWQGGRLYDRGVDGSICQWGRVLAVDPPHSIVLAWDISPQWQVQTDPARASEVEVQFLAAAEGTTRVVLEHRHLDRHGDGWEGMRQALAADDGWPIYAERYRDIVDA